ncbi:MAG: glycosyltransferase family 4 protein [Pyrinomonadaceae bacterium]|nr:glycosyltransferase family 4 protein [Pyrinomonadaceae bacterium]
MARRIVLLGPCPPPYGGVAIFTKGLFEFVRDSGVELWSEGLQKGPQTRPTNYRRLGLVPLLLTRGRGARIIDQYHFLLEYPNPLMVPIWIGLKLLLRFKWIKVVHDGSLPSRYQTFSPLRKFLFGLSARSVDEFVTVNDNIGQFLRDEMGVSQTVKTVNALLPIQPVEPQALSPELESAFTRFDKVVVSTGVFIPSYGFAPVADAVETIRRESGNNIGLVLIDGAFIRDDEYRNTVLRQREWIVELERVPHPQVLQIFRRSNVFVRGFRYEGYGLSRIEAIWCGIPVIAARGEESRGILLYDFEDTEALVAHLRKVLTDSNLKEIDHWAAVFQREAEENLERWKHILAATGI